MGRAGHKRGGRKRKPGKRQPNTGRLAQGLADVAARLNDAMDKDERETIATGIEARVRVHGVSPTHARDQLAGSFVGRLCIGKEISRQQYEAAMMWLEDRRNYLIATSEAQGREPGAVNLNATHGRSGHENVAWAIRSVARYRKAGKAVQAVQDELRGTAHLFGALDNCVSRDVELFHLLPDLRYALNALARHYGLAERLVAA